LIYAPCTSRSSNFSRRQQPRANNTSPACPSATRRRATSSGTRYYVNRTAAHSCQHKAPPKVQEKMQDLIERAEALKGEVTMQDPANQARGARVPTLKNTFVTSDISGDRRQTDVQCTCGSPSTNGFPCIHNVKHAQLIGMDPYDLLHYKDTTAAWREQYDRTLSSRRSPRRISTMIKSIRTTCILPSRRLRLVARRRLCA